MLSPKRSLNFLLALYKSLLLKKLKDKYGNFQCGNCCYFVCFEYLSLVCEHKKMILLGIPLQSIIYK